MIKNNKKILKFNKSLDFYLILRGLLALSVAIWHYCGYLGIPEIIYIPGRYAVWGFFCISGYVIYLSLEKKITSPDWLTKYFKNRLLRIYPNYILFSIIGFLFIILDKNPQTNYSFTKIISDVFFLKETHEYKLNVVFWTIGIEMQFYVIVPVIFLFLNKFTFFIKLLLISLLLILSNFYIDYTALKTSSYDFRTLSGNLSFFFIGMFCAILKQKFINNELILNNLKVTIFFLLLFFIANIYIMSVSYKRDFFHFNFWTTRGFIFAQMGFIAMIFLSICLEKIEYTSFTTNALYLLGNSAYALYASHIFFIMLIGPNVTFFNFLIYILCSIVFSVLIYKFFEKPILKYKLK